MIKFLYFRTTATLGDDDASGDSVCYPVTSLMGMQPTGDTYLALYFKQLSNQFSDSEDADDDEGRTDKITVTLSSANTHKAVMKNIIDAIAYGEEAFIIIGDDESNTEQYISGITDVRTLIVREENN